MKTILHLVGSFDCQETNARASLDEYFIILDPGHETISSNRASTMPSLPQWSPSISQPSNATKVSEK